MNIIQDKLCIIALVVGLMGVTGTATAGLQEFSSVAVNYSELNLSTEKGIRSLYRKIQNSAEKVCGNPYALNPLKIRGSIKACIEEAVDNAVRDTNIPMLMSLHQDGEFSQIGLFAKNQEKKN